MIDSDASFLIEISGNRQNGIGAELILLAVRETEQRTEAAESSRKMTTFRRIPVCQAFRELHAQKFVVQIFRDIGNEDGLLFFQTDPEGETQIGAGIRFAVAVPGKAGIPDDLFYRNDKFPLFPPHRDFAERGQVKRNHAAVTGGGDRTAFIRLPMSAEHHGGAVHGHTDL